MCTQVLSLVCSRKQCPKVQAETTPHKSGERRRDMHVISCCTYSLPCANVDLDFHLTPPHHIHSSTVSICEARNNFIFATRCPTFVARLVLHKSQMQDLDLEADSNHSSFPHCQYVLQSSLRRCCSTRIFFVLTNPSQT